ncbi:MAG: hypothetical protein CBC50_04470 [Synechococcus sp. TMED90]|nr:MAG: hypothetical protein CBC50_04470 [Synechococcus sp. TMED90]
MEIWSEFWPGELNVDLNRQSPPLLDGTDLDLLKQLKQLRGQGFPALNPRTRRWRLWWSR